MILIIVGDVRAVRAIVGTDKAPVTSISCEDLKYLVRAGLCMWQVVFVVATVTAGLEGTGSSGGVIR